MLTKLIFKKCKYQKKRNPAVCDNAVFYKAIMATTATIPANKLPLRTRS